MKFQKGPTEDLKSNIKKKTRINLCNIFLPFLIWIPHNNNSSANGHNGQTNGGAISIQWWHKCWHVGITGTGYKQLPRERVCVSCSNFTYDTTLDDLLPYLKAMIVGVISASPLSMGLITENSPPASSELKDACRKAADFCKKKGKDISKLSMKYSLCNEHILWG
ncbi:unnamed protein product [Lactuca virosa]|uniref:Uncharacterized protein n=1 Tax=Lactuca virosa TaxID=75947 RepID=A0AAU9LLD7_9ASTR|nr:unnamed protein product [Lactuca virosa]